MNEKVTILKRYQNEAQNVGKGLCSLSTAEGEHRQSSQEYLGQRNHRDGLQSRLTRV